ncbi:HAD family hydrolase [Blastococcus montanus]|uniref:HAD family hydrolase n=1 Tax=Blastococcus montanus TaxID=3144973 RepID=UPI003208AEC9
MPPHRLERPVLAVDLDGTLLRSNTFPSFVRMALRRSVVRGRLVSAARLVSALVARKVFRGPHERLKATVHRVGERLHPADIDAWVSRVHAADLNPEVARLVAEWRGPTVLATSAPALYADLFGELSGFTTVQGSEFVDGRGYVENVHAAKAERLQAVLGSPLDCAITDDLVVDGPLLALAARRLVVEPSGVVRELHRQEERSLPETGQHPLDERTDDAQPRG